MKIGVSSYSFSRYIEQTGSNYLHICDLAREIGFEGIEFTDLLPNVGGHEDVMEIAREIREHCEKIGLNVIAYTVGANFLRQDIEAEVKRVMQCVDVAVELGAPIMRHDACWAPARQGGGYTWRDAIAAIAPHIRRVTEYAKEKGVRTCTENHGQFIQEPERVEALMREVNHKNYGWLVDMGNFLCADYDCLKAMSIALPYAFHVHAKDFLFKKGSEIDPGNGWFLSLARNYLRGTVVGHGVVPVSQCIRMLKDAGYDGYISLEFEGMEENLPALEAGLAYLRRFA